MRADVQEPNALGLGSSTGPTSRHGSSRPTDGLLLRPVREQVVALADGPHGVTPLGRPADRHHAGGLVERVVNEVDAVGSGVEPDHVVPLGDEPVVRVADGRDVGVLAVKSASATASVSNAFRSVSLPPPRPAMMRSTSSWRSRW